MRAGPGLLTALLLLAPAARLGTAQTGSDRISSLVQRAKTAQQAGQISEAIEAYREILKIRPGWGPVEMNLGLLLNLNKNYPEAIRLFTAALQHDSTLSPAYLFRGIAYYNTGQYDRALTSLEKFLKLRPDDREVRFFLAGTQSALGRYLQAALLYLEQIRIDSQRAEVYYRLGDCYIEFAREGTKALAGDPNGKYFLQLLAAEGRGRQGDLKAAEQQVQAALAMDQEAPEAHISLGQILLQQGAAVQAWSQFDEALKRSPTDCRALAGKADAARALGQAESPAPPRCSGEVGGGLPGSTSALLAAQSRRDSRNIYQSARIAMRLAEEAVARLISVAPDSYLVAMMRAQLAEEQGNNAVAEQEYQKAIALGDRDPDPLIEYGRFKCKLALFRDSIPPLRKAVSLDPYNVRANALLGEAYLTAEQPAEATPPLQLVVKANPRDAQSRILLARSLANAGKTGEAITVLEAAPADDDGRIHFVLGNLYRQQGRAQDAARALQIFQQRRKSGPGPPQ